MRGIAVPFLLAGVWACVDPPSDGADPDPPAPAETTTEDAALAAGLDSVVTALLATHDIPGASLAIARDGRVVLAKGYGWADTTARIPTRPEHRFRIARVSKPVTAIAILTLIERGRLALDDRPFSFLGTVPSGGGPPDPRIGEITVADLLRHRAGFDRTRGLDPTLTPGAVGAGAGGGSAGHGGAGRRVHAGPAARLRWHPGDLPGTTALLVMGDRTTWALLINRSPWSRTTHEEIREVIGGAIARMTS